MKPTVTIVCQGCGVSFSAARKNQRYCCQECKRTTKNSRQRASRGGTDSPDRKSIPADLVYFYELKKRRGHVKSYREIRKENQHRKVQGGWRGTPVSGAGAFSQSLMMRVLA